MPFFRPKAIHRLFLFVSVFVIFIGVAKASDKSLKAETAANILRDDLSGEDMQIRRAALKALGTAAGTVVVMNAQTGRVYSIVNQEWAIKEGFKPCSTIKLVTGVAGITERLIKRDGDLARGSYRLGLNDALAYSNNTFFQKVGKNMGSAKLINYARSLGLGDITGINAEGEFAGKLPFGNENLRIYSHADDFEVTPLQLAVMVSALTNGGKVLIPQIPRTEFTKTNFRGYLRRHIKIAPRNYERVIPGMVGAVNYGTARRINDKQRKIAGKTGSCIFKRTWVGLFASVAPIQNPKYAVVVITRGKYARGKYSAAIAGSVYKALSPRFDREFDTRLARREVRSKATPRKTTIVASAPKRKPADRPKKRIERTTVITYRRDTSADQPRAPIAKRPVKKPKKGRMTVYVNGKPEIVRPRVVQ